jgi:hypothetical protein
MKTQQQVLRDALTLVLGSVPVKGQVTITPEQRELVADEMMKTYEIDWVIKSDLAKANPRAYIVGEKSTDLIQSWTFKHLTSAEKKAKAESKVSNVSVSNDKVGLIKAALDAGLITQEVATAKILELLAA